MKTDRLTFSLKGYVFEETIHSITVCLKVCIYVGSSVCIYILSIHPLINFKAPVPIAILISNSKNATPTAVQILNADFTAFRNLIFPE